MSDAPPPISHTIAWSALILVLGTVIVAAIWSASRGAAANDDADAPGSSVQGSDNRPAVAVDPPVIFAAPDFSLIAQDGRPLGRADLAGHVWIADFFFTCCAGPCPLMTQRMAELQKEFAVAPRLRLVSFTVDPQRDTPEVLTAYGRRFGADPKRWTFLTGDAAVIHRLATDGFKVAARTTTPQERAQGMDDILHSTYFVLVDAAGNVRGLYDSTDPPRLEKLRADVRTLLARGGE